MTVTKKNIEYQDVPCGTITTIPAGTRCVKAKNIPQDDIHPLYWAKPWKGMTEWERSWQRKYGFLLLPSEVTSA